jgi:hypothetical protein
MTTLRLSRGILEIEVAQISKTGQTTSTLALYGVTQQTIAIPKSWLVFFFVHRGKTLTSYKYSNTIHVLIANNFFYP